MFVRNSLTASLLSFLLAIAAPSAALADEDVAVALTPATTLAEPLPETLPTSPEAAVQPRPGLIERTRESVEQTLNGALDLIGIRYRRGGSTPERGFDCSGFVSHVFREGLGLYLPRSAREMSKTGEPVAKDELQPGDLVFFNTMRRTFSHVGIYLGDNLFVHAPRTGGRIRIEDLGAHYWTKRFTGARRVVEQ
jgi:cell wall-associated NlpC family hydrolase